MRSWFVAVVGFSLAASLPALPCSAKENTVQATAMYRQAFGRPPKTEGRQCTAAVVFLPGIGASGAADKLSAVPLFSVSADKVLEEATRVLVEGYPTPVRELRLPLLFPKGSKLLGVQVAGTVAVVVVASGGPGAFHPLALQALAQTLSQFQGIRSVTLEVKGRAPVGPEAPRSTAVEEPPPPRLLDMVSSVHEGEKPSEIDILFDRPVDILRISLREVAGKPLAGTSYSSMFDMAAVFRPRDLAVIRTGLPLEVRWSVRDRAGRKSDGERTLPLRLYTHPR